MSGGGDQGKTHGVGSVLLGHFDRVNHIALGLRHLLLVGVPHQSVNVDLTKRNLARHLDAQHDHAGDPEEENIEAGVEQRGGVERLEILGLAGPAHRREGPESRAEPGVEDIGVLCDVTSGALRARIGIFSGHRHFAAVPAVPGRNAVAPPKLTRDAPIADVVHPLKIVSPPLLGDDLDASALNRFDRLFCQRLRGNEPLR